LRGEHCDQGQGFLYSGPIDSGEMTALLDTAQAGRPGAVVEAGGAVVAGARPTSAALWHAPSGGRAGGRPGTR
jgi:hypothetical protein